MTKPLAVHAAGATTHSRSMW